MNHGIDSCYKSCSITATMSAHDGYRRVLSTANKLETIQNKLVSVIDLFATPLVSNIFSKLCNDCVHLLIDCDFKLEEFRKAEELVWRRAYHSVYRLLKGKRQVVKKQDECLIEAHFMSGLAYYSELIVQLRVKYKVIEHVQGIVAPLNLALAPAEGLLDDKWLGQENHKRGTTGSVMKDESQTKVNQESAQQWARQAIYRSIVYMGDLARYMLEFSEYDHRKLAFELYRSASRYQPDQGLPYNQLATLAGDTNHSLDAICNYMRCCLRPKPFERAEGNMIKLFELNRKHHDELVKEGCAIKVSDVLGSKDPVRRAEELMKSVIVTFLKLASDLWFATGENLGKELQDTVVHETQTFFEILREAMELDPIVPFASNSSLDVDFRPIAGITSSSNRPRYVSPTIIYEFCSISIMLIARRQQESASVSSPILSAVSDNISDLTNTLALNLLHYATSKCQRMIISKIQDLRLSRQQDSSFDHSGILEPSSELSFKNSSPVSSEATSRRVMTRMRQKRAATSYSSALSRRNRSVRANEVYDSDLSELEETALSTIDALDISSEMSDAPDDLIDLESSSSSSGGDSDRNGNKSEASSRLRPLSRPALRPTRSQTYDRKERFNDIISDSCNSLPMPDLVTGDLVDISFKTNPTIYRDASVTPSEFGDEVCVSSTSNLESTLSYIYSQTYLPTIKVFFDWLLSNRMLIDSNLESFSGFQAELIKTVELLNELKILIKPTDPRDYEQTKVSRLDSEVLEHSFSGPEWNQRYPLGCDFAFMSLNPMKLVHKSNIDFDYERELDDAESGFITMQCIFAFSYALSIFIQNKGTS